MNPKVDTLLFRTLITIPHSIFNTRWELKLPATILLKMKRTVFTIIVALMASYGFGQIQRKTIFDFTQPLKLTPAVIPTKEDKSADKRG